MRKRYMDYHIKLEWATKQDIEFLVKTEVEAFADDEKLYGAAPYGKFPKEEIAKEIEEKCCYKIVKNNEIIGGAFIKSCGNGEYRLKRIWLRKHEQGKGIGTSVIKIIETNLVDKKKISLDTPYKSYRNQSFYEKQGFKKIKEIKIEKKAGSLLDENFILFEYVKNYD